MKKTASSAPFRFREQAGLIIFILCCLCAGQAYAQQNRPVITINEEQVAAVEALPAAGNGSPYNLIACFPAALTAAQKEQLAQNGIVAAEYIGSNAYILLISPAARLEALAAASGFAAMKERFKISPSVKELAAGNKQVNVLASFYSGITTEQIRTIISDANGTVQPYSLSHRQLYKIQLPATQLNRLAGFYGLRYISQAPEYTPLDMDSKGGQGVMQLSMPTLLGGKGLTGKNVVIGHGDQCSGIYHIDQSDRVINYNPADIADHGVLVNGIIGGDGIMDPAGQGIATDATFLSHFFDALIGVKDEMYLKHGMTLTNNSYATLVGNCTYAGTYDNISQFLDSQALVLPEVLDVFAAGNDGRLGCRGYAPGYANVCGGFQTAKNVLDVGATYRDYIVGEGSSRGPIKDGRLKPEITAMGMDILCPVPDNRYTITRGTSLSCPQVAGGLGLLTERYRQLHSNANPRSDLLKAIMINGASDLGRPGPDFLYGFGFMDLTRSLSIMENTYYKRDTIASGAAPRSFNISVPANTGQLKVLLYYHDPVASAASATQLVNDLDLTVTEPGGGTEHKPLILDPSISGVGNIATEGADRLNNVEQVTINNPTAGSYTVNVAAFAVPEGPQEYIIAYDFVPEGVHLLSPVANATAAADTVMYIYWNATPDPAHTFSLEYSTDDGSSWNPLSTVAADTRVYRWRVPAINSAQCRIRISRSTSIDISGSFVINSQPIASLSAAQCPGSISLDWTAVPGASKYYLLLKKGPHFQKVDSVTAGTLSYTYSGLSLSQFYFVAVQPLLGGKEGYRSMGVIRKPDNGSCSAVAHGDLSIEALASPQSGRRFSSSALTVTTPVIVNVRNRDNIAVTNYSIAYRVNGGSWSSFPVFSIGANTTIANTIAFLDLSAPGDYTFTIAVHNNDRADPVTANDTIVQQIRHLPNDPVLLTSSLDFDFESLPDLTLLHDTMGLTPEGHWDYSNSSDTGRLRTRIPGSRLVTSNRSISMDVNLFDKKTVNYFTGTFNLSNYDTSGDEVRFDFEYEMRGMPVLKDSNKVWVRGMDTNTWIPAYAYDNTIDPLALHSSGTISLKDLLHNHGQNFSASTQIRFGQFDSTLIADDSYGGGLTLDNIHIYKISKDVLLASVEAPFSSNCDMSASPVTLKIKNGTTQTATDIVATYRIDGQPAVVQNIPWSLGSKDSMLFTFSTGLSGLSSGTHNLQVWLHMPGDDYTKNDSLLQYNFVISPLISSFPYLENFESGAGNWYSGGTNNSWALGQPVATKIKNAASGLNAWKTNLTGTYNNREQSFLYSPCINTSALSNPMLSFSTATDIEHCDGTPCDAAYVEYSTDNERTWQKLGSYGTGTNWYSDEAADIWNLPDNTRWHVASSLLPKAAQLKLRFVLQSDPGSTLEGIAVDDIHIFDLQPLALLNADSILVAATDPGTGTARTDLLSPAGIISSLIPGSQLPGMTNCTAYRQPKATDEVSRQYIIPRSLRVQTTNPLTGDISLRLYVSEDEVNRYLSDTSCRGCTRAADIYRTGVSRYTDATKATEDQWLANDTSGAFSFYPYNNCQWVPYDKGYYVQLQTRSGEFWFNDGGLTHTLPVNTQLVAFEVTRADETTALLEWSSEADTAMISYTLQRSADSINFTTITVVNALKTAKPDYTYNDLPAAAPGSRTYYRILGTLRNAATFLSPVRFVDWDKESDLPVHAYPVPSTDGKLFLQWSAIPGQKAFLQFTDLSGRSIHRAELVAASRNNISTTQLNHLAKGVYFLKTSINNIIYTQKIILQ